MIATLSNDVSKRNNAIAGVNYERRVSQMKQSLVDSSYKTGAHAKDEFPRGEIASKKSPLK